MSKWISVNDRLPKKEDADKDGYIVVLLDNERTDFCKYYQAKEYKELGCASTHWLALNYTDSDLTITDPADQLQVALNALELAERESETLKAENEKLNETLAIYKNRYDVCNEY